MERDFMGLNSKDALAAMVKEEVVADGYEDSGCVKSSAGQFSFSNKVSGLPHLMPLLVSHDDKTKKNVSDTLNVFMPISGTDAVHSYQFLSAGGFQMFSGSKQAIVVPLGNNFGKNHLSAAGQNSVDATIKLPGGVPITAPHSGFLPIGFPPAAITDLSIKPSLSRSQLTIFYAGNVNVFDDISPEKAREIMLLAGNCVTSITSKDKVESGSTKLAANTGLSNQPMNFNQSINVSHDSRLSSPLSVSSHNGAQSASGSSSTDEFLVAKSTAFPSTHISKGDPAKTVNATMFSSAVPQARKASLARFLEKRKERVMNVSPYSANKKLEECFNPESKSLNFSTSTDAAIVTQASQ